MSIIISVLLHCITIRGWLRWDDVHARTCVVFVARIYIVGFNLFSLRQNHYQKTLPHFPLRIIHIWLREGEIHKFFVPTELK